MIDCQKKIKGICLHSLIMAVAITFKNYFWRIEMFCIESQRDEEIRLAWTQECPRSIGKGLCGRMGNLERLQSFYPFQLNAQFKDVSV